MLELDSVHTYYGQSHVLQGLSLRINQGETVALLGRNGVGKTTTIKSIIGYTPPRSGRVLLRGQDITGRAPHEIARLGVGLVPQGREIFPTLTVRENITLAARDEDRGGWSYDRVLNTFPQLKERLDNKGAKLSGGEQQMLAIGRALMTNPQLLLLDEPSEGLAPLIVAETGRIIKELSTEGLSILVVEQNLAMALDVADRVYVLNKGQVVYEGIPADLRGREEVLHQYLGV